MQPHLSSTPIVFHGDLDISRYPEFRREFERARLGDAPVFIDLSDVNYVDSIFVSELLLLAHALQARQRRLVVLLGGAQVRRLFAVADLDSRISLYIDREDALAALARPI